MTNDVLSGLASKAFFRMKLFSSTSLSLLINTWVCISNVHYVCKGNKYILINVERGRDKKRDRELVVNFEVIGYLC